MAALVGDQLGIQVPSPNYHFEYKIRRKTPCQPPSLVEILLKFIHNKFDA
jgi:hypothetical protein